MTAIPVGEAQKTSTLVRFFQGLTIILAVFVLVSAVWLYDPLPENPDYATLSSDAANYDAEIIRDNWGVPHVFGKRDADTSFGLAYAHAEDDFETIQEVVAATRGVLARYRGADAAPTDYVVSFLDVWPTMEAHYASGVPDDVKAIADAYAAGINLYAAENPDATWAGLAPFRAEDVVAGFMFKTPFFYGLDKVLQGLFEGDANREVARAISLAPTDKNRAFTLAPDNGAELGSNAIAVSAERGGDGITRLLINSHQPLSGPVAWYEAHLVSEEGLNITGGLFPGTPLILHGFNENLGWANTVNHIDLSDVYVLTRNPENPMQYKLDGEWVDFEVTEITLPVKLFGPFAYPAKRPLLRSKHGPVVERDGATYALRYTGMGEVRQLEQYYRLNQAENLEDFMAAMRMNALPSINYVYGDKDNNIAFIHNAQYPNRADGWDWSKDMPGDRSELIWQGYRPFTQVPKLINPQSGLLFNANNTPYDATDGPDNLTPAMFPPSMGLATNQTNRSMRLIELTDGTSLIDRERLLELKFDDDYSSQSRPARLRDLMVGMDWSAHPDLLPAVEHMKGWNLSTDVNNRHTALVIMALRKQSRNGADDESPAAMAAALRWAVEFLTTHHGGFDVRWGDVSRLVRGDVNMEIDGGPDVLRAIYAAGDYANGIAPATHGDTWIGLVEWDQAGKQTADIIHNYGSATLDATSPHYADQAPLFATKKWRRALTTRAEIEANATRMYRPGK